MATMDSSSSCGTLLARILAPPNHMRCYTLLANGKPTVAILMAFQMRCYTRLAQLIALL